jgi:hypothetical protein
MECFWSFDPAYLIGPSDIAWVAAQLRKHGGRRLGTGDDAVPLTDYPASPPQHQALRRLWSCG